MPNKKKPVNKNKQLDATNIEGLHAEVLEQPITQTLKVNYMPYAMSVIVSRAIPEIDGFKPSHRKLLYTMYQMKLLAGTRTKSANVVGATMKLNPHGDAAIYETMVRLSRGYGALLHPLVDSKGNFGKVYSRDMAYAASRYTEVRLDAICEEIFRDIDKDTVDFVPNYDSSMEEPTLLPTTFPNVLVSANQGIAVGMASNLCGFNLAEVCETTIARIKKPTADLMETLLGPDLPTGGELLFVEKEIRGIYETGRGSFKVRSKWRHLPKENVIEIFEIPYSTTVEVIIAKVTDLVKVGKIREIADMRDETDLSGLKLTIDLKRGTDPQKLMQKLYRMTSLQDSISCNFNVLVEGMPRVMGVGELLDHWIVWRMDCVRRQTSFTIRQKEEKLHLLLGLRSILLDIDRAIAIIRETQEEAMVIPHLMEAFSIDKTQADYVADIRLRNINKEYILKRVQEVEKLQEEIEDLKDLLDKPTRIRNVIISQLKHVKKTYGTERRTQMIEAKEIQEEAIEEEVPAYPVHLFLSQEGYVKKITPQSLRMSGEQKYKEGDGAQFAWGTTNAEELLLFTNQQQCYKLPLAELPDSKASLLGEYLPARLEMQQDEVVVWACLANGYKGQILFFFENGKVARLEASSYQTVTKRKKLTGAYSDKSPLVTALQIAEDTKVVMQSSDDRLLVIPTEKLLTKQTRSTQGVQVMNLKKNKVLKSAVFLEEAGLDNPQRYRARSIPSAGTLRKEEEPSDQMSIL